MGDVQSKTYGLVRMTDGYYIARRLSNNIYVLYFHYFTEYLYNTYIHLCDIIYHTLGL